MARTEGLTAVPQRRSWKRFVDRNYVWLMLLPSLVIMIGLFGGGLFSAVMQSLGYFPLVGLTKLTLRYYVELVTDSGFLRSLWFTFYVAAASTLIASVISTFVAVNMKRVTGGKWHLMMIYKLPLAVPYMIVIVMAIVTLSGGGILARVLYALRIIQSTQDFPRLLYTSSGAGVIWVYVWKFVGFMTLSIYSVYVGINANLFDVARTLGASTWRTFWHVTFPLLLPGIVSSSLICFAFSFGSFEVPLVLGPSFPNTLPVFAYVDYMNAAKYSLADVPLPMATMVLTSIISVLVMLMYRNASERLKVIKGGR